jgi:hypothetical protein
MHIPCPNWQSSLRWCMENSQRADPVVFLTAAAGAAPAVPHWRLQPSRRAPPVTPPAAAACRYTRLEALMSRCYPHLPLRPSPEDLAELFKVVR